MKEKPILFSTPMVKAVLEGRKTMTRRVVKPQPELELFHSHYFWHWKDCQWADGGLGMPESAIEDYCPYKKGDRLWVRESWNAVDEDDTPDAKQIIVYKADGGPKRKPSFGTKPVWRPSIHMYRIHARIFLEVKNIRVERIQDISEEDAKAEGVIRPCADAANCKIYTSGCAHSYRCGFGCLWDHLNEKRGYSWESNPWVWVIEFARVENAP